jgi:hypothetical protein
MNTLEMWAIYEFVSLSLCIRTARKWVRRAQPWTVLDWPRAIYYGYMLIASAVALLDNLTHPALIQPAPRLLSYLLWLVVAVAALDFLGRLGVSIGRRIRQLGRQS